MGQIEAALGRGLGLSELALRSGAVGDSRDDRRSAIAWVG